MSWGCEIRAAGSDRDDVSVFTCRIVVTVARTAAMPNAALSAIKTERACIAETYS
jgi:hypothetical protein